MWKTRILGLSILCFFGVVAQAQTKYYVDGVNGNDGCTGLSPVSYAFDPDDCAKVHIQAALDLATSDGDEVIVADACYSGDGNRDLTLYVDGGYSVNITIRSANGPAKCVIDVEGDSAHDHRAFDIRNQDPSTRNTVGTIIQGFTIQGGYIDSQPGSDPVCGGGIRVWKAQPTIRDCIIQGNSATSGGGVCFYGDNQTYVWEARLESSTVQYNTALTAYGGGIANLLHADSEIHDSLIRCNSADDYGGGVYWDFGSDARIFGCVIESNSAVEGGGIYAYAKTSPNVTPQVLSTRVGPANSASSKGGGLLLNNAVGDFFIENSNFVANSSDDKGGGMALAGTVQPKIVNTLILGNSADTGGGIFTEGSASFVGLHDTFSRNASSVEGSAIYITSTTVSTLDNSVVWDNDDPVSKKEIVQPSGTVQYLNLRYDNYQDTPASNIKTKTCSNGNVGGFGLACAVDADCDTNPSNHFCTITPNITSNPSFVDANGVDNNSATFGDNNYRLNTGTPSPAIDRANDFNVVADEIDLDEDSDVSERIPIDRDGRARFQDDGNASNSGVADGPTYSAIADMGAYESPGIAYPVPSSFSASPADGTIDARHPHPEGSSSFGGRRGIGSPNSYTGGPEPITITLGVTGADDTSYWELCETGIEEVKSPTSPLSANSIDSVTEISTGVYEILLDRPISAGAWTTITYLGSGDSVSYASLPGDVDASGSASASDIDVLIAYLGSGGPIPFGSYSCDANHSGACNPSDILQVIDLLNGAGTFVAWEGKTRALRNACTGAFENLACDEEITSCDAEFSRASLEYSDEGSGDTVLNQEVADWLVNHVTTTLGSPYEQVLLERLAAWYTTQLSEEERSDLLNRLGDSGLEFASESGCDAAQHLLAMLAF